MGKYVWSKFVQRVRGKKQNGHPKVTVSEFYALSGVVVLLGDENMAGSWCLQLVSLVGSGVCRNSVINSMEMEMERENGKSDLFKNVPWNPGWSEIKKACDGMKPEDRTSTVPRVFHCKLKSVTDEILKNGHLLKNCRIHVRDRIFEENHLC